MICSISTWGNRQSVKSHFVCSTGKVWMRKVNAEIFENQKYGNKSLWTYLAMYFTEGTKIGTARFASSTAKYECTEYGNKITATKGRQIHARSNKNPCLLNVFHRNTKKMEIYEQDRASFLETMSFCLVYRVFINLTWGNI